MALMPVVHIIEDDASSRRAFVRLMQSAGFEGIPYASVDEFLASHFASRRACIVTDVHMQGLDALELPNRLRERGIRIPVIFVTADYSATTRERIRGAGGHAYFKKPVDDQALIDMIQWATTNDCDCNSPSGQSKK